jgi:hypothetical protein
MAGVNQLSKKKIDFKQKKKNQNQKKSKKSKKNHHKLVAGRL